MKPLETPKSVNQLKNLDEDTIVDLWEDVLHDINHYLNRAYAGNVKQLVALMRYAVKIDEVINALENENDATVAKNQLIETLEELLNHVPTEYLNRTGLFSVMIRHTHTDDDENDHIEDYGADTYDTEDGERPVEEFWSRYQRFDSDGYNDIDESKDVGS